MLNITTVFESIFNCFGQAVDWLFSHGLTVGNFTISFGSLAVAIMIIQLVFSFLPGDTDGGEE